jgi:hypothetical protein
MARGHKSAAISRGPDKLPALLTAFVINVTRSWCRGATDTSRGTVGPAPSIDMTTKSDPILTLKDIKVSVFVTSYSLSKLTRCP